MAPYHGSDAVLVSTTFQSPDDARRAAAHLVSERLAACAQLLGPIESTYWWQGAIESAPEWLLLLKTTRARYPALEAELLRMHPYDTPQIIALPIELGSAAYLQWLAAETVAPAAGEGDAL
jgi:periplasmic divalent cation tolerance protein